MNIDSIIKITEALSNLASCNDTIEGIITSITGAGGSESVVDAINSLDANVQTGFSNVVNALGNNELVNEWSPFSESLTYIYNNTSECLTILSSITLATSGTNSGSYIVTKNTQEILFVNWAQGTDVTQSSLATLASFVEEANYGPAPGQLSLSGMFTKLESNNSILDLWVQIAQGAQVSQNGILAQYKGQTIFNLVTKLMGEFFTILGMIYYAHDATLKALNQINSTNDFVSLAGDIESYFANTGVTGTVWNLFATQLTTLANTPSYYDGNSCNPINPEAQVLSASLTCDQYPGSADNYSYSFRFVPMQTTAPANSFFTSLQITQIPNPHSRAEIGPFYVLQGVPATIGANLELSSDGIAIPDLNSETVQNGWGHDDYVYTTSFGPLLFNCILYPSVPPPQSSTNNVISVVTGFTFASAPNNQLVIALQFGELDVSDCNNPVVTVTNPAFQQPVLPTSPSNSGYMGTPDYIDLRPAGAYALNENSVPVNQLGIVTNCSLICAFGNRLGLNVQMAAPLYAADFFQPDKLPSPL